MRGAPFAALHPAAVKREALLDLVRARVDRVERAPEVGRIHLRKESEATQVHAEHRVVRGSGDRQRSQYRAVTAGCDHKIRGGGELVGRHPLDGRQPRSADLGEGQEIRAVFSRPTDDRVEHFVAVPPRVCDDTDRLDAHLPILVETVGDHPAGVRRFTQRNTTLRRSP